MIVWREPNGLDILLSFERFDVSGGDADQTRTSGSNGLLNYITERVASQNMAFLDPQRLFRWNRNQAHQPGLVAGRRKHR